MPAFIVYGNLGQPSAYIEFINATDQAEAVRKTVKKHGRGFRRVYVLADCPADLQSVLPDLSEIKRKLNNGEELYIKYSEFRKILNGQNDSN